MNLMLRVSLTLIDIESQKAEGPGVLAPIDPDVGPFHEAIVDLEKQLRRGASPLVRSCARPRDLRDSDKAGEIGDLRWITTALNHGRHIVMDESLGKGRLETAWNRLGSGTCHFCAMSQFRDPKTRAKNGAKSPSRRDHEFPARHSSIFEACVPRRETVVTDLRGMGCRQAHQVTPFEIDVRSEAPTKRLSDCRVLQPLRGRAAEAADHLYKFLGGLY